MGGNVWSVRVASLNGPCLLRVQRHRTAFAADAAKATFSTWITKAASAGAVPGVPLTELSYTGLTVQRLENLWITSALPVRVQSREREPAVRARARGAAR